MMRLRLSSKFATVTTKVMMHNKVSAFASRGREDHPSAALSLCPAFAMLFVLSFSPASVSFAQDAVPAKAKNTAAARAGWSDLSLGNVVKDDFNAPAYQYPLIGNGGLSLLADPGGLTQLKPPKAPYAPNIYFSYWWESSRTKRATPFRLKGGYGQGAAPDQGSLRSFRQTLDVVEGVLTSKVNLILSGSPVASTRTEFVTADGVLVMEIADSVPGVFRLQAAGEQTRYSAKGGGLLASTASPGEKHGACLAIVAEGGGRVDAHEGSVALPVGPGRPARFFIAAGSEDPGSELSRRCAGQGGCRGPGRVRRRARAKRARLRRLLGPLGDLPARP